MQTNWSPMARVTVVMRGHWVINVSKTMTIAAPLERVFAFWANYKNFPIHVCEQLEE